MDRLLSAVILTCCLCAAGAAPAAQSSQETPSHPCFKVFDGMMFKNRPSLKSDGLEPISVLYASASRWPFQSKDDVPDGVTVQEWIAKRQLSNLLVLDVEHWPLGGDPAAVRQSLDNYRSLFSRVKAASGHRLVGYYSVPPLRDYWRSGQPVTSEKFKAWQAENDSWQTLADDVDVLFPSLYTFYNDSAGWVRYAKANLEEARRVAKGKPVYAFIWPQYHESNKTLGLSYIPDTFWRLQLDTVAAYADGAVIWGGFKKPWDPGASWWRITREFVRENVCRTPSAPTQLNIAR